MERPTSVTVFGILNIAKGALGILGSLWSIILFSPTLASTNPVMKAMVDNTTYMNWMHLLIPIGVITSAIVIVIGIGLLWLKPWARKASIGYAIYAILFILISVPFNFIFVFRPLLKEAQQLQGPEAAGMIGGAIGGTFGGILGLVYPILLWIFMTRPSVVAAFQKPPPLPSNIV